LKIEPEQIVIALIRGFKAVIALLEKVRRGEDVGK